ncbi:hypothetical protein [Escherichia coli]|uniref:hypothetical protein n=1 Tax=Escherichia coli TaxID=562 RepID=UPI00388D28E7
MLLHRTKRLDSYLFTGTGKFASSRYLMVVEAIRASGSQLVTLAMKRVDLRQHNDRYPRTALSRRESAAE